MATIKTRVTGDTAKGSPLTNAEVDANFINLNNDKLEVSGGTMTGDLVIKTPSASLVLEDSNNGTGGGAQGWLYYKNTTGTYAAIGTDSATSSHSDLVITNNPSSSYTHEGAISDLTSDIVLDPMTHVRIANGSLQMGETTVIDSDRNLENIADITGSGNMVYTGDVILKASSTTTPILTLEVTDENGVDDALRIRTQYDRDLGLVFESLGGEYGLWMDSNGDDSLHIRSGSDNSENSVTTMEFFQNNNVAIPNGRLQVGSRFSTDASIISQAGNIQLRVGSTSDAHSPFIRWQGKNEETVGSEFSVYADIGLDTVNEKLYFNDPGRSSSVIGTNPMTLDSSGNLEVSGDVTLSGDITAAGNALIQGSYLHLGPTGTATEAEPNQPSANLRFQTNGWDENNAASRAVTWYVQSESVASNYPEGDLVFYEESPSYGHEKLRLHGRGSGSGYQDPIAATFSGDLRINRTSDNTGGGLFVNGTALIDSALNVKNVASLEIVGDLTADTIIRPLKVTGSDFGNTIDQTTLTGVGLQFEIPSNDVAGGSFVGATVDAMRSNSADADSSTGLSFKTSGNGNVLNEALWLSAGANIFTRNTLNAEGPIISSSYIDVGSTGAGTESDFQAASPRTGDGAISTPWMYTEFIESFEKGTGSVGISLSDGSGWTESDEIALITDGAIGLHLKTGGHVHIPRGNLFVTDGKFVQTHSTTDGFIITATDDVSNANFNAAYIDYNVSGSQVHTVDNMHVGLRIDVDSSATGGNTGNEHRIYGINADVRNTGDSDLVYGGHFYAESQHSAGQSSGVYGLLGYAVADDISTGHTSSVYGVQGLAYLYNTGTGGTTTSYGGYFKSLATSGSDKNVASMHGVYAEVEVDANGFAGSTIDNIYGVRSIIDFDQGSADPTTANSYLFRGEYTGTRPANDWGVFIENDVPNYFGGEVRSNVAVLTPKLYTNSATLDISVDNNANDVEQQIRFLEGGVVRMVLEDNDLYVHDNIAAGLKYESGGGNRAYDTTSSHVSAYSGTVADGSGVEYRTFIQSYNSTDPDLALLQAFSKDVMADTGTSSHNQLSTAFIADNAGRWWTWQSQYAGRVRVGSTASTTAYRAADNSMTAYSGTGTVHGNATYMGYTTIVGREAPNTDDAFAVYTDRTYDAATNTYSGGQLTIEFDASGNGRFDGGADISAADYAEYFEWADGNPDNEDRRGHAVVLTDDGKIRIATADDDGADFLGIVSVEAAVVGDSAWAAWTGKWERDRFGQVVMEDYELLCWGQYEEESGSYKTMTTRQAMIDAGREDEIPEDAITVVKQRKKRAANFDPNREYIPRKDRQEWQAIGLMGKLPLLKGQPTAPQWRKLFDLNDEVEMWLVR
jgi:hypothetical protein